MMYRVVTVGEDICHHGIKGQKWGVRRYQNKDGSLTSAGRKRYTQDDYEKKKQNVKKAIMIGSAAVAGSLAVYGAYKLYDQKVPKTINVTQTVTKKEPYQAVIGYRTSNLNNKIAHWPIMETRYRDIEEVVTQTIKNPWRILP